MKISVKPLVLSTIFIFCSFLLQAQLKLLPAGTIGADVKTVIDDYPNRFANLRGDLITENTQSAEFKCNFEVRGAEESSVTRYSSRNNNVCSWQAVMLSTESFEKARQKFRSLYTQLNNLSVRTEAGSFQLKGTYESPAEEKKFASVIFDFTPAKQGMEKLKAEVLMTYELTEWKVKVLVYDREREDEERGPVRD